MERDYPMIQRPTMEFRVFDRVVFLIDVYHRFLAHSDEMESIGQRRGEVEGCVSLFSYVFQDSGLFLETDYDYSFCRYKFVRMGYRSSGIGDVLLYEKKFE